MKQKKIAKLESLAKHKLNVLQPSNVIHGKFTPSYLHFDGYSDLLTTIESLINVCVLASHIDNSTAPEDHGLDIRKTLELANKLLPFEEGEFLDEAFRLLVKKP